MGLITQYINVANEKKSLKTVIGRKELVDFAAKIIEFIEKNGNNKRRKNPTLTL